MEKNILKRAAAFIGQDTKAANESKKTIVVLRIILIFVLVYCAVNIAAGALIGDVRTVLIYMLFIVAFAWTFFGSYHSTTTKVILWVFNIAMMAFMWGVLIIFGWNIGVQHFLIVMLLLYFFSSYNKYKEKFAFALVLCGIRMGLFYFFREKTPLLIVSPTTETSLQMINTVTIFGCISVIAYVFSKDSQELEGKLVEYNEQLRMQANTDKLTELPNRRRALDCLEELVKNAKTDGGFCVCIADIDFFKKVNDNYGHDFGDEVLKEIAAVFKREMQDGNLVARWGGEEFLLLFPKCNGDNAYQRLERIRREIKDLKIRKSEIEVQVTMTFGLAEYDFSGTAEGTIKDADDKLYIGKEQGRDRIIY